MTRIVYVWLDRRTTTLTRGSYVWPDFLTTNLTPYCRRRGWIKIQIEYFFNWTWNFKIEKKIVNLLPYDLSMWPKTTHKWTERHSRKYNTSLSCIVYLWPDLRTINHETCCSRLDRSTYYYGFQPWFLCLARFHYESHTIFSTEVLNWKFYF